MDVTRPRSTSRLPRWKIFSSKEEPILLGLPTGDLKGGQSNPSDDRVTSLSSKPRASSGPVNPRRSWRGSFGPTISQGRDHGSGLDTKLLHDHTSNSQLNDNARESNRYSPSIYTFGMGSINDGPDDGEPGGKPKDRNEMKELPLFNILPAHSPDRGMGNRNNSNLMDGDNDERPKGESMRESDEISVPLVHLRRNSSRYGIFLRRSFAEAILPIAESPEILPIPDSHDDSTNIVHCTDHDNSYRMKTKKSMHVESIPGSPALSLPTHVSLSPSDQYLEGKTASYPWTALDNDAPATSSPKTNLYASLPPLPTTDDELEKRNSGFREHGNDGENVTTSGDLGSLESNQEDDVPKRYDNEKGKHILGFGITDDVHKARSRLERNKDAQGIIQGSDRPELKSSICTVWLGLLKSSVVKKGQAETKKKLLRIDIPNDLVVNSVGRHGRKGEKYQSYLDFDDEYFAWCLHAGYGGLLGNDIIRKLGARKITSIQVARTKIWSGSRLEDIDGAVSGLLAVGKGLHGPGEPRSPFTEAALFRLYQKPATGKARYAWVHWARRLATSNMVQQEMATVHDKSSAHFGLKQKKRILSSHAQDLTPILEAYVGVPSPLRSTRQPDTITTIQFVCELSAFRVCFALSVMLSLSILASVLWIFLDTAAGGGKLGSNERASGRVGSGMAIAVLVLLLEGVGFGAWVWLS